MPPLHPQISASPASRNHAAGFARPLRIALCGPIAEPGRPAGGGYEAANRKTCDALARAGHTVVERPYPKALPSPLARLLGYGLAFMRHGLYLLAARRHYDVLHITPLRGHFLPAEVLLIGCIRIVRKPVLVDIRAGKLLQDYAGRGVLHRRLIDWMLRHAGQVAVEGASYISFVQQRTATAPLYLPNFVEPRLPGLPAAVRQGPEQIVRLIYFGRLVPEKGIDVALQTMRLLMHRGHRVELTLIGSGPAHYVSALRQQHADLPVHWAGEMPSAEIMARAGNSHFFLFASRHDGEGHSNALNEAMAAGVVPVCSTQGFSGDVVGDAGVVLPVDADAGAYAEAIHAIVAQGSWGRYSSAAQARVSQRFSEEAAIPGLLAVYCRLLDPQ